MENVYRQMDMMRYHGGWSFIELYNLPIGLRNWHMQELLKQKETEANAVSGGKNIQELNESTAALFNVPVSLDH